MTAPKIEESTLAREAVRKACDEWPDSDIRRLAYLVRLGTPAALHSTPSAATVEYDTDPGGVIGMRGHAGEAGALQADLLHVYRHASRLAGVPLPPPGVVK